MLLVLHRPCKCKCVCAQDVPLSRSLVCVTDPVRYCSHAVRAFIRELFGVSVHTAGNGSLPPTVRCPTPPPPYLSMCASARGASRGG